MTTTYGIREFKAQVSEILHGLDDGDEVIITRHGKPCGRLTMAQPAAESSALKRLRELGNRLPDLEWEDFVEAKKIWEPRIPEGL